MKEIKAYKTKDGTIFETIEKAIEHEIGKKVVGKAIDCRFYDNGALFYKDDDGYHLFAPDREELTKNAVGKVVSCVFYNNIYQYKDDNGIHKGQWKPKK